MLRSESSAFVLIDCKISKAKNIERPRLASGRIFGCTSGDKNQRQRGHVPRVRVDVGDGAEGTKTALFYSGSTFALLMAAPRCAPRFSPKGSFYL